MAPVKLNPAQVLGAAALGVFIGGWLKRKIPVLDRWNIPVPIAGGMVFALAALALHGRIVNVEADTLLRDLLMIAFMSTIGLGASVQLLRKGGRQVILLLVLSSLGAVLQNLLGIGLAMSMGIDKRLGILAGSVALAGGPATALAWGDKFESWGVHGATTAAMAAATFGIAVAGLIGGHIGGQLIRRRALRSTAAAAQPAGSARSARTYDPATLLSTVLAIGVAMGIGNLLSQQIESRGIRLPAYIGAMIVAAAIRNGNDRFGWIRIPQADIDTIGRVALYLFITMALLTLRLWELAHLALPLLVILTAEVALCWMMCVLFPFRFPFRGIRRDYENAVTSAGFCGYMLGITANAMASMEELAEKYGPAPESFLAVPVVGAFLVDFTNSFIITAFANLFR
jgi:ESS family glutamate:Na+ symporter